MLNAARPRQQLMQTEEIAALQRRLSRVERQVDQVAESLSKGCIRIMSSCAPAAFHANVMTLIEMLDGQLHEYIAATRLEATALILQPRHVALQNALKTSLHPVLEECNEQQRMLDLPEVWQTARHSESRKSLNIPPRLCYEAWKRVITGHTGQAMHYIFTKYPNSQRTAFMLRLESDGDQPPTILTTGYMDIDNATVVIEICDRLTLSGIGINGREVEEVLKASWKYELALQTKVLREGLTDPFANSEGKGQSDGKGGRGAKGRGKGPSSDAGRQTPRGGKAKGKGKFWEKGKGRGKAPQRQQQHAAAQATRPAAGQQQPTFEPATQFWAGTQPYLGQQLHFGRGRGSSGRGGQAAFNAAH